MELALVPASTTIKEYHHFDDIIIKIDDIRNISYEKKDLNK